MSLLYKYVKCLYGGSLVYPESSIPSQQSALWSGQQELHFSVNSFLNGSKWSQPTREEERACGRQKWRSHPLGVRWVCSKEIFFTAVHWERWWEWRGTFKTAFLSVFKPWCVSELRHSCHLYLLSLSPNHWNCRCLDSSFPHAVCLHVKWLKYL